VGLMNPALVRFESSPPNSVAFCVYGTVQAVSVGSGIDKAAYFMQLLAACHRKETA
jgi:hypothetical protein